MKITIRTWTNNDCENLTNLCNNVDRKYLSNNLPFPYTIQDATNFINYALSQDDSCSIYRAIEVENKLVGNISIEKKSGLSEMDSRIGYMIDTYFWNQGIATYAVAQLCKYAFDIMNITRISGEVHKPNIASQKVLLNNNFVLEGTLKDAIHKNGNLYDMLLFAKYC